LVTHNSPGGGVQVDGLCLRKQAHEAAALASGTLGILAPESACFFIDDQVPEETFAMYGAKALCGFWVLLELVETIINGVHQLTHVQQSVYFVYGFLGVKSTHESAVSSERYGTAQVRYQVGKLESY